MAWYSVLWLSSLYCLRWTTIYSNNLPALNLLNAVHTGQLMWYNQVLYWYFSLRYPRYPMAWLSVFWLSSLYCLRWTIYSNNLPALNLLIAVHTGQLMRNNRVWYWYFSLWYPRYPMACYSVLWLSSLYCLRWGALNYIAEEICMRWGNLPALNLVNAVHTGQLTWYKSLWYWYFSFWYQGYPMAWKSVFWLSSL
jgi:hypothetical protein